MKPKIETSPNGMIIHPHFEETDYGASKCGKCWSKRRYSYWKELSQSSTPGGYKRVQFMSISGKRQVVPSHRFIFECKAGKPIPKGFVVHHIDNDPNNNTFDNLDAVSRADNSKMARRKKQRPITYWDKSEKEFPIPGYPNYYITKSCKVISYRWTNARVLKTKKQIYSSVTMVDDKGKWGKPRIQRLMWMAFRGPIPLGMQINHENGNKNDNRLENLELVTRSENALHAHRTGLHGGKSAKKFNDEEAEEIRKIYHIGGFAMAAIAEAYGASNGVIALVIRREHAYRDKD